MNQNYKSLMLGLMLVMAGQSLYSAAAGDSGASEEDIQAFFDAAKRGDSEAVLQFLQGGIDINAATTGGFTALMGAAFRGHLELVRFLLEKGADFNAVTKENATALMGAARLGYLKIVEELLEKGADVNVVSLSGSSALTFAVEGGHSDIVQLLLEEGALVDAGHDQGRTALLDIILKYPFIQGDPLKIARLLLDHRANVNFVDNLGYTVLAHATMANLSALVKLLLAYGADSTGVNFSGRGPAFEAIAAVFRAQREDVVVDELPRQLQQILEAYREFQAGRPQRLKELLGIPVSGQNMLMNMQQGKSSVQHRPYVARVEALLGVSREDLKRVFKKECVDWLMYYLKTGKFKDTPEQGPRFLY